ncbi:hypothetical protein [Sulfuricurvum sp.]|uniref:hypothetical protein n=1 Tax=Sulfuricurvum sp. TaxID=2025608 RepID=UPI002D5AB147|nr:hypothetical protein [Sulfuricurvum sp.]HZF70100.1 hypothetical protein [Sulfuricurvum sp.]
MRGSIYFQTAELTKAIFVEGTKKEERIDPYHINYNCVSSYKSMETYRGVWNNFGCYLREYWGIKDFEQTDAIHVKAYMSYKIEYYPTKQYLEKISSALGKLETALIRYTTNKYGEPLEYDFNVRQQSLNDARSLKLVANGYHNRVYKNPLELIESLSKPLYHYAALMQLYGGARAEGVCLIKPNQLHGYKIDNITGNQVGIIETKEKGGKVGDVLIPIFLYKKIEEIIAENGKFRISYKAYSENILNACRTLKISCESSHGFRWTFAQNRVRAYQIAGYTYDEALQGVSLEMKHYRASITEHYVR